jgi:hypothetical protein
MGVGYLLDRRRTTGWCANGVGTLSNISATASGWIGCLAWGRRHCLQHGQKYSERDNDHRSDHSIPRPVLGLLVTVSALKKAR